MLGVWYNLCTRAVDLAGRAGHWESGKILVASILFRPRLAFIIASLYLWDVNLIKIGRSLFTSPAATFPTRWLLSMALSGNVTPMVLATVLTMSSVLSAGTSGTGLMRRQFLPLYGSKESPCPSLRPCPSAPLSPSATGWKT